MLFFVAFAQAASLDNLEVGGPWGTPTSTDGTAIWWNPAGVAAGHGTRIHLEGAPMFATVTYERLEPDTGVDTVKLAGVIPTFGLATDLGVPGLGLGLGLAVPIARGGVETVQPGPGAYHLEEGMSQALYAQVAVGYSFRDRVAVGGTAALVRSQWGARLLTDTLPDLDHAIELQGEESGYTDAMLEDPDYAAELEFDDLTDLGFAFSLGLRVAPIDTLAFGVTYVSGTRIVNEGDLVIHFGCPPQSDTLGRFGAEDFGVCYADVPAQGSVGYTLPGRVMAGVQFLPLPELRIEAMGGWVGWSAFTDYDIVIHDAQAATEEGSALVEQERQWARDNHDSVWGGLDVKGELLDGRITLGARGLYDQSAVPDQALSLNNYDANVFMISGLFAFRPVPPIELGLSFTHHVVATRTITQSGFAMTLADDRNEDRWYYPTANGTYSGTINRIGVQARAAF